MARSSYDKNGGSTKIGVLAEIFKNTYFSKMLGMASPGVENVATLLESIFALPRGSQLPYTKKIEKSDFIRKKYSENIREYSPY